LNEQVNVDERLRGLISRIERCLRCYEKFKNYGKKDRMRVRNWYNEDPWFFPPSENGKVKGFFGTGKVFFVCLRPSLSGKIPNYALLRFYGLIEKYGFGDAHMTDLIKCRAKAGEMTNKDIEHALKNCLTYLKEEIEILKPNLVIAVGSSVYEKLIDYREALGLTSTTRIEKMTHFSYRYAKGMEEMLDRELREIKARSQKS